LSRPLKTFFEFSTISQPFKSSENISPYKEDGDIEQRGEIETNGNKRNEERRGKCEGALEVLRLGRGKMERCLH